MNPQLDLKQLDRDYTDALQKFLGSLSGQQSLLLREVHRLEKIYISEVQKEQNEINTQ